MALARFSVALKNTMLNAIKTAFDAGSGPATIKLYTGTMPASPDTAITTQVLLGTLTFSDPSGAVAAGVFTGSAITEDSSADANGTATWARIADSTGVAVLDVDVTVSAGTGALKLNTTTIVQAGPIRITAFTISFP